MPQSPSQFLPTPEVVVFTGDLVSSSRLSPEEIAEAMRALETAAREMTAARGAGLPRFTQYRGDGWQCLGPAEPFALRGALMMRARLATLGRSFDTRISIGVGSAVLEAASLDLKAASGPAFELSGRGLDKMGHSRRFAIAWQAGRGDAVLVQAILSLCDEISRNWTPAQAKVFAASLGPVQRPNQETLAAALDITQQMVAKHLASGGDWALREALQALEGAT